jgi:hypothetical protein
LRSRKEGPIGAKGRVNRLGLGQAYAHYDTDIAGGIDLDQSLTTPTGASARSITTSMHGTLSETSAISCLHAGIPSFHIDSVALYRRSPTEWMTMSGPVGEYNVAGVRIYLQLSPKFAVAVDVTRFAVWALSDANDGRTCL